MRVLLLSQFYPPIIGGEERHVRALAHALVARGHDVCVATLWRPDAPERDGAVRLRYVKGTAQRASALFTDPERRHAPPFPDPELSFALKRVVDAERPDVVHAHNWIVHAFLPVKFLTGLPLVLTMHDYGFACPKKNAMRREDLPCDGPALGKCVDCAAGHYGYPMALAVTLGVRAGAPLQRRGVDAFLAVSAAVARFNGFAADDPSCAVVSNFVPDDVERLDPGAPPLAALPAGDFILFVGDLYRQKGVHILAEAYARLKSAPPLVLIGRRCADTPAAFPPNVIVIEGAPHEQVKQAWSRCLFGVLPSICRDACPTVAMEAMAFGKPMIGADVGGMASIIDDCVTGLLVPPGNIEALTRAMSMLLADSALRESMGAAGAEAVRRLKASAVVEKIEGVYRRVIARGSASSAIPAAPLPQERGR
ncbi:glycosyltransferase family 4 protein [Methylocystis sp. S23]